MTITNTQYTINLGYFSFLTLGNDDVTKKLEVPIVARDKKNEVGHCPRKTTAKKVQNPVISSNNHNHNSSSNRRRRRKSIVEVARVGQTQCCGSIFKASRLFKSCN